MRCEVKRKERTRREYCYTVNTNGFVLRDFIYAFESALPSEYTFEERGDEYKIYSRNFGTKTLKARMFFYKKPSASEMAIILRRIVPSRWLSNERDWERDSLDESIENLLGSIPPKLEPKPENTQETTQESPPFRQQQLELFQLG